MVPCSFSSPFALDFSGRDQIVTGFLYGPHYKLSGKIEFFQKEHLLMYCHHKAYHLDKTMRSFHPHKPPVYIPLQRERLQMPGDSVPFLFLYTGTGNPDYITPILQPL